MRERKTGKVAMRRGGLEPGNGKARWVKFGLARRTDGKGETRRDVQLKLAEWGSLRERERGREVEVEEEVRERTGR